MASSLRPPGSSPPAVPGSGVVEICVPITSDADIVLARQRARDLACRLGFPDGDRTVIAAAISEIARNIVAYAGAGSIRVTALFRGARAGLVVEARDAGPGIRDVAQAMQMGYSTCAGLGLGLPGARRLMDEFELVSEVDKGTVVRMTKWRREK